MAIELTEADRVRIDACYELEWGGGETKVAEYYLCEAAYLAGIRAGLERAAVLADSWNDNADRWGCARDIRALAKP